MRTIQSITYPTLNKCSGIKWQPETITQKNRIESDGGTVIDLPWMNMVISNLKAQGIYSNAKLLTDANFGVKKDGSGAVSKLYDISGNNNDAIQTTGANQPIWSLVNGRNVIAYNGTNTYLNIPDSVDWNVGSGNWTVDFWMKTLGNPINRYMIGMCNSVGADVTFYFNLTGAKMRFYINDGIGYSITSSTSINNDAWHHIAGVVSEHVMKLYIDGVSEGTPITGLGTISDRTTPLVIGRVGNYNGGSNFSFVGYIDKFRFSKGIARWTSNFTPPMF